MTKTKIFLLTIAALVMALTAACGGGVQTGPIQLKGNQSVDFTYGLNDAGNGIVITGYTGAGGKVTIPAVIENLPVVEIGENSFRGSGGGAGDPRAGDGITSVIVPIGVRKIGRGAFSDCRSLISVTMPDTVEEIMAVAFRGCTSLVSVNLPASLKMVGINAFSRNGELRNLSIPNGIAAIEWQGWNHFAGCSKLPLDIQLRLKALGYPAGF